MIMNYNLLYHFFLEWKKEIVSQRQSPFLLFITPEFLKFSGTIFYLNKELLCTLLTFRQFEKLKGINRLSNSHKFSH